MSIWNLSKKLFSCNYLLQQVEDAQEAIQRKNQYVAKLEEDYIKLSEENKRLKSMVRGDYLDLMFNEVLFSKNK